MRPLRPARGHQCCGNGYPEDERFAPSRTLYAATKALHESAAIRIYPPYGSSREQGHSFAYRGTSIWFADVLSFLEANCKP